MTIFFLFLFLFLHFLHSRGQITVNSCQTFNDAIDRINKGENIKEIQILNNVIINQSSCNSIILISKSINIVGLGNPPPTIMGDKINPIFFFNGVNINFNLINVIVSSGGGSNGGCVSIFSHTNSAYFKNVIFQNCSSQVGGAVYSLGGSLIFDSVQFISNSAVTFGGAITVSTSYFPLIINNSIFKSNIVTSKNDVAFGGAIHSDSELVITNSTFSQNNAISNTNIAYGGAINSVNSTSVINSSFFINKASSSNAEAVGGAICANSSHLLQINSSNFENNVAISVKATSKGGAVYSVFSKIYSSNFKKNVLKSLNPGGGAVFATRNVQIFFSSFLSNQVYANGKFAKGGAVLSNGRNDTSSIQKCTFRLNSISASGLVLTKDAEVSGGAVHSEGILKDDGNSYNENSALFIGNNINNDVYGGAISCNNDLFITKGSFVKNRVQSYTSNARGGAVHVNRFLTIHSSKFVSNNAISNCKLVCNTSLSGGGAIYNRYGSFVKLSSFISNSHRSFKNNSVSSGGAIFFSGSVSNLSHQILFTEFSKNSALSDQGIARGGAISTISFFGVSKINNSFIRDNTANGVVSRGGAIFLEGFSFITSNSTFRRNKAMASSGNAYGGAIDLSQSGYENFILSTLFELNKVTSTNGIANGGAIFHGYHSNYPYPPLILSNIKFYKNVAAGSIGARGGSLFVNDYQSASFSNTSFSSSNTSSYKKNNSFGGAIFAGNFSSLSFCAGNIILSNNYIYNQNYSPIENKIYTGIKSEVKFCPLISFQIDWNSTFTPVLKCDTCDCGQYSNPCHPLATCAQISKPKSTYCICPLYAPGSGFSCGEDNNSC